MIIDEVVWNVINHKHCSFRVKADSINFCRNEYNLTGLCNRRSCPLANSQYATVREEKGVCYLFLKTAERAHMPSQLWEKIKLDKNYGQALAQIDENLLYWSPFLIHKCKQRLTKLRQMLIQTRKLRLEGNQQFETVSIKKKAERRDRVREAKALVAANLETRIEEQLLERLKTGVYQDIYNYNPKVFDKILQQAESQEELESEQEDQEAFVAAQSDEEQPILERQPANYDF